MKNPPPDPKTATDDEVIAYLTSSMDAGVMTAAIETVVVRRLLVVAGIATAEEIELEVQTAFRVVLTAELVAYRSVDLFDKDGDAKHQEAISTALEKYIREGAKFEGSEG